MGNAPQVGLSPDASAKFFTEWGDTQRQIKDIHDCLFGPAGLEKRVASLERTRIKLIMFCVGGAVCVNALMNTRVANQIPGWASLGAGVIAAIMLALAGLGGGNGKSGG